MSDHTVDGLVEHRRESVTGDLESRDLGGTCPEEAVQETDGVPVPYAPPFVVADRSMTFAAPRRARSACRIACCGTRPGRSTSPTNRGCGR